MGKKLLSRFSDFLLLTFILPFISGCNGGGGSGTASLGSLFSASSEGFTLAGGVGSGGGGTELATIHNPEPTTMLLVGGGMMAMAYFRNRLN